MTDFASFGGGGFGGGFGAADAGFGGAGFGGGNVGFGEAGDAGTGMFNTSSQTNSQGAAGKRVTSITPVTLRQIIECGSSDGKAGTFTLDGFPLGKVKIVARIKSKNSKETQKEFVLDDSTGVLTGLVWIDEEKPDHKMDMLQEGAMVRVHGNVREFASKRQINIFDIRPVEDENEMSSHGVHCVFTTLQKTKGPINPSASAPQAQTTSQTAQSTTPTFNNATGPSLSAGGNMSGVDATMELVWAAIKNDGGNDNGKDLAEVVRELMGKGITEQQVRAEVLKLEDEGHVYSTIDATHYKST